MQRIIYGVNMNISWLIGTQMIFMQMQHKNKRRLYTYKIKKGFTKLGKMEENHGLQEHYMTDHKNEGLA